MKLERVSAPRIVRSLMPVRCRGGRRVGVGALSCLLLASAVEAESDMRKRHEGELERWVVSGALEVGVMGSTGKGNVRGTPTGPPRASNIDPVRIGDESTSNVVGDDSSREQITSALVGGSLELMSPAVADVPSQPRFFMDVFIAAALANEVSLARDGNPGAMGFPDVFDQRQPLGERLVAGRGNGVFVQPQGPQVHAGIGPAFTFDLFGEHRIRIKPSLVYSRLRVDVKAVASRAVRTANTINFTNRVFEDEFRTIELQDRHNEVYHGLGPALELEYDTGNRFGPFEVTLFMKGHASRLFGDVTTDLSKANPNPLSEAEERVFWKYRQDRWIYRGSTGVRLRYLPKRKR